MKTVTETVWNGHDNRVELELREDGVAKDLSGVTRVTLTVAGQMLDSDQDADLFDWGGGGGRLVMDLGGAGLAPGNRLAAKLVVYDAEHDDGIVWGDSLRLTVKS